MSALLLAGVVGAGLIGRNAWRNVVIDRFSKKSGKGKVIVVTGAASGIGKATSIMLLKRDWTVFALDFNPKTLEELKSFCNDNQIGERLKTFLCDISRPDNIHETCLEIKNSLPAENQAKGIDVLVNNAGMSFPLPVLEMPIEKIETQFKVNLFGPMMLTKELFPLLIKGANGGTVINVSSASGLSAWPWQGVYAPTKFGLEGYSDVLRREIKASKINLRVVKINPGGVNTHFGDSFVKSIQKWVEEHSDSPFVGGMKNSLKTMTSTPNNAALKLFLQEPEDLAKVIIAAASNPNPEASYWSMAPGFKAMLLAMYYSPTSVGDKVSSKI